MIDLWPEDIGQAKARVPVAVLQEQAALLGKKTQNVVEAKVIRTRARSAERFGFGFHIVAVGLGTYVYRLFTINYGIDFYPVLFHLDEDIATEILGPGDDKSTRSIEVESEEALLELLGKILKSEKTKRIIDALLSQATYLQGIPSEIAF